MGKNQKRKVTFWLILAPPKRVKEDTDVALLVLRRLDELSADTVTGRQMVTDRMLSSESALDREARSSNGQTGITVPPQWCTPEQRLSYYRAFASEPETSLRPQPAVVGASQRTDGSTAPQQHEQFQLPEDIEAIEACIKGATPGDKIRAVWRERPALNGVYVDTSPVIWSGVVTGAWDEPTRSIGVRWDPRQPRLKGTRLSRFPEANLPDPEIEYAVPTIEHASLDETTPTEAGRDTNGESRTVPTATKRGHVARTTTGRNATPTPPSPADGIPKATDTATSAQRARVTWTDNSPPNASGAATAPLGPQQQRQQQQHNVSRKERTPPLPVGNAGRNPARDDDITDDDYLDNDDGRRR
ncbi:Hypothetical protein, putative [Bodo saltans]|uniref:Uncharacterized protein n=1 Tax=Bodo saltans TaxID=75058 RepID=A0A0S4JQC1_BODSA|nr:Hypothetical protein, putative [Bodo saltans]|eukprot:CUG93726.1 Hypothetical protein, putative [Bodo saltans]